MSNECKADGADAILGAARREGIAPAPLPSATTQVLYSGTTVLRARRRPDQSRITSQETLVCKFICLVAFLFVGLRLPAVTMAESSATPIFKPLRVAIVGLVHGHVSGFLGPA